MSPAPASAASAAFSSPGSLPARSRAETWLYDQRLRLAAGVDRSFAILMAVQYAACLVIALTVSRRAWGEMPGAGQPHLLVALLLGGVISGVPVAFARLRPGGLWTRHVVAIGQILMSGLLIHLTGGRIETHFHLFGSLAFLAFYRDWRVLITASGLAVADLILRGHFWPQSVYGIATVDHWRWLEHTGWILFEDTFLIVAIRHSLELLRHMAGRRGEIEEARDVAEQASRAKDDFMAVLSHELRTPLTPSLMTLSALAEDEGIDPETRASISMVHRNVELEARLIDDLLDLTRITSGKLQLSTGHVDLHSILTHINETCREEFRQKSLTVTADLRATRHWLFGDGARLQQVFWNLLKNAVKFTPTGGTIEIRTVDAGDKIRVDVVDSGIGITPDVLPKIFQRFEQGGSAVTKQFGGLGLGLSISRAIVEMHRGVIRADSRGRGWGSTFTIALPAQATAPAAAPASQTQKLRLSGALPRRVLLVDDHLDTRETLDKLLTRAGYQVTSAESVASAVELAGQAQFDILVSDLGLPDGHGNDLMRDLHARFGLPGVAFSGFGMEEDVRQSHDAGFSAHLTKPVDFRKLKEAMSQALSEARAAGVEAST